MQKAVFLDRDGVINSSIVIDGKPYPPRDLSQLKIIDGVSQAISLLKRAGYLCIVITNQPDVARGKVSQESVEEINKKLLDSLAIDEFYSCYHDDADDCKCRKPKPGFILVAAEKYNIDLKGSYMVGDRWRDIEAGQNAGCMTIFIDYRYKEKRPTQYSYKAETLLKAAQIITGEKQ